MINIIKVTLIPIITLILIINTNYVFANNNDDQTDINKANQYNDQNNHCRDNSKCDNQSLEQLNNQNNHCRDNSKCINQSTSNIVVCKERSLCLIQYQGPFELANPY